MPSEVAEEEEEEEEGEEGAGGGVSSTSIGSPAAKRVNACSMEPLALRSALSAWSLGNPWRQKERETREEREERERGERE